MDCHRVGDDGMPKRAAGLTARQVQSKPLGTYADGGGLYLRVGPTGARSWIFRYQVRGRRRDLGLGPVDLVTLAEARDKAFAARKMVFGGGDPIDQRRAERNASITDAIKTITFRECAEGYINAHRAGWKNATHAKQWPTSLEKYVYPTMGKLAVDRVDTAMVLKCIEPLWRSKPETASRVRGRIERVLDWAKSRELRNGENPARWRGHMENLLPKTAKVRAVKHFAALPYDKIAAFIDDLRNKQGGIAARALEFAILTAARSGEVLGARWTEVDTTAREWRIPSKRMKTGKPHRVPLSEPAMAIVDAMVEIRHGDFVFPGQKEGSRLSDTVLFHVLQRMGRIDLTTHGFRSTFSDWCAERTGFAAEVREASLAHAISSAVEAAYRRGDLFSKRRQLMDSWGRYCTESAAEGAIVPIRSRA